MGNRSLGMLTELLLRDLVGNILKSLVANRLLVLKRKLSERFRI